MNTDDAGLIITVEFHENDVETDIFNGTYLRLSSMLQDLTLPNSKRGRDSGNIYISSDEYLKTVTITLSIKYPDDDTEFYKRMMADINSFNNFSNLNDLPMYCQHYSVLKWSDRNPQKG